MHYILLNTYNTTNLKKSFLSDSFIKITFIEKLFIVVSHPKKLLYSCNIIYNFDLKCTYFSFSFIIILTNNCNFIPKNIVRKRLIVFIVLIILYTINA